MNKKTRFWIYGKNDKGICDISLMSEKWRELLEKIINKFNVEYDEETDAYYIDREKYFNFKKEAKKTLITVEIYTL